MWFTVGERGRRKIHILNLPWVLLKPLPGQVGSSLPRGAVVVLSAFTQNLVASSHL